MAKNGSSTLPGETPPTKPDAQDPLHPGYDAVVVGSGAAGLAAATAAALLGLKVLVAEKDAVIGGTTALSGGFMWLPGNPVSKRAHLPQPRSRQSLRFGKGRRLSRSYPRSGRLL
jgi:glycine/D-amino acid oxidase-like deaminating enzyme